MVRAHYFLWCACSGIDDLADGGFVARFFVVVAEDVEVYTRANRCYCFHFEIPERFLQTGKIP